MNLHVCILQLHIYTWGTLMVWPMPINSIDIIGQLIIYVLDIYILHTFWLLRAYYHYPSSFNEKPCHTFCCLLLVLNYCANAHSDHIFILGGILIIVTMALHIKDEHIMYYHRDATWSVDLLWTYVFLH